MRTFLACFLSSTFVCGTTGDLCAQQEGRYSIGINAGTFVYSGDLAPGRAGSWKTPAFVWGLTGTRAVSSTLSARLDLSFGNLRGNEASYATPEYRHYRALAFNTSVRELVLSAEWNPLESRRRLAPYLFAGVGYAGLKVNPDASRFVADYFSGEPSLLENLKKDAATTLPKGTVVFPVGAGLRYRLNDRFSLYTEIAHRFTRNDYLDGFSYAGNPQSKDNYTKYSIGLRTTVGNRDFFDCPVVRY